LASKNSGCIDLEGAAVDWSQLRYDFRVILHAIPWPSEDALTVSIGTLFRKGEERAVFAVHNGRVHTGRPRFVRGYRPATLSSATQATGCLTALV
jgi:hypothetical protein